MYLAPEILRNQAYDGTVDFWNFGCFVYELLIGENPFSAAKNLEDLFEKIKNCDYKLPEHISPEAKDLVKRLLVGNPDERLGDSSIEEIKQHPFFANVNWKEVLKNNQKGKLAARYQKDEVLLKALNVKLPTGQGNEALKLKGFTFNENFQPEESS